MDGVGGVGMKIKNNKMCYVHALTSTMKIISKHSKHLQKLKRKETSGTRTTGYPYVKNTSLKAFLRICTKVNLKLILNFNIHFNVLKLVVSIRKNLYGIGFNKFFLEQ